MTANELMERFKKAAEQQEAKKAEQQERIRAFIERIRANIEANKSQ